MLTKKIKRTLSKVADFFSKRLPDQNIKKSKKKWNKLASENARYYVVSRKGRDINEDEFKESGKENYVQYVASDPLLKGKLVSFSDKTVLNIGCGVGRLEEFFATDFRNVHGVDISGEMVARARKRLAQQSNVQFQETNGISLPFPDNFFDFVFSYLVFQHMPSRAVVEKNLLEVFRVLKPGMMAKIQVRGGHTPFKWQWFYGPSWNKEQALALVTKIGFRVLKMEGEGTKRFWIWLEK
ncbi:MAG: class I SAM-dependent methyltransferase [bacterium]|nr:class I SAM-dependent methyltransferase [bacterium]